MDKFIKGGYFFLGVIVTLLVCFVSAPIWYWDTHEEENHRKNMKRYDGEIVIVIGHGKTREKSKQASGGWIFDSVQLSQSKADLPLLSSEGKWHENYYVTFENPKHAINARNKIMEAIDQSLLDSTKP